MSERGKDLVKIANLVRCCGDLIEKHVHDKLMLIVVGFEKRCGRHTNTAKTTVL